MIVLGTKPVYYVCFNGFLTQELFFLIFRVRNKPQNNILCDKENNVKFKFSINKKEVLLEHSHLFMHCLWLIFFSGCVRGLTMQCQELNSELHLQSLQSNSLIYLTAQMVDLVELKQF